MDKVFTSYEKFFKIKAVYTQNHRYRQPEITVTGYTIRIRIHNAPYENLVLLLYHK